MPNKQDALTQKQQEILAMAEKHADEIKHLCKDVRSGTIDFELFEKRINKMGASTIVW